MIDWRNLPIGGCAGMGSSEFRRDWLPSWLVYANQRGMKLSGSDGQIQRRTRCTIHGGERDSLTINVTGPWLCQSCGARGGDVLTYHRAVTGLGFVEAARELGAWDDGGVRRPPATLVSQAAVAGAAPRKHETLSPYGRTLWEDCRAPLAGVAEAYLLARHCAIPPVDGDLRWHPALKHQSGYVGPALVALVTNAITRQPMTLHRTWIRADGSKPVNPPRLPLRGHRKKGGVVRLWPDEAVATGLAIGEGIDYKPVWSLIDAGNLNDFPVLGGIEALNIGADHDDNGTGIEAASACADRWAAAGVDVRVIAPRRVRTDWNDRMAA
jgi:hypothetical protein